MLKNIPIIIKLLLLLMVLILGAIELIPWLSIKSAPKNTNRDKFEAIIVLGNPANIDGTPGSLMKQRVIKAVELFKNGYASYIICTGGAVYNQYVEAEVMAKLANSLGVPNDAIFKENQARNSYENAYYSVELMKIKNLRSAIIVTSPYHVRRTSYIFFHYPIEYETVSSDYPDNFSVFKRFAFQRWENYLLTRLIIFGNS